MIIINDIDKENYVVNLIKQFLHHKNIITEAYWIDMTGVMHQRQAGKFN